MKRSAWVILLVLMLDQLSKWWIMAHFTPGESLPLWGDFLRFTYVRNEAGVMGIKLIPPTLLPVLQVAAMLLVLVLWIREARRGGLLHWVLAAILGGGVGNLVDRFRHGWVVDFIDVDIPDIHLASHHWGWWNFPGFHLERWWVFNVADSFIFVSMFVLLFYSWFHGSRRLPDA